MADGTTQWVDLSAHGLTLAVCEVGGMRLLGVTGEPNEVDTVALTGLGFVQATEDFWVREGDRVDMEPILDVFPQGRLIAVPMDEFSRRFFIKGTAVRRNAEEAKRERDAASAVRKGMLADLLKDSRKLGSNHLSQEVWSHGDDVRFLLQSESKGDFSVLAEGAREGMNEGLFLRATSPQAAATAADGYVEALASGEVRRWNDLKRLVGVLWSDGTPAEDNDPRLVEADALVRDASVRWLARRNIRSATEAFHGAQRMQEARAWRVDLARRQDTPVSISLPLSVAMQRIAGTEGELRGKTVVAFGAPSLGSFVPSTATVSAWSENPEAQAGIFSAARRASSAMGEGDARPEAPYVLLHGVSRALLDEPVEIDGLTLSMRADVADAARMLLGRLPDGRAVIAFDAPRDDRERSDIKAFHLWAAQRWAIEGAVDIAASLGMGGPGDPAEHTVLSIGQLRPAFEAEPPDVALRVAVATSHSDLWAWTSSVAVNRAEIGSYFGTTLEEEPADEAAELQANRFQRPYVSLSLIGTATTMVPCNLEAATREAQVRLKESHPDFDSWVCARVGMTPEQAVRALSPEQVDAVGMVMHAWERDRAALIGDMTGLGKGRAMAAIARAAILEGKNVLFITERPLGFGEIARDFQDIGAWDDLAPFVMNADVDIKDSLSDRLPGEAALSLLASADRGVVRDVAASGKWPEGCNIVFSTYSQFNKAGIEKQVKKPAKKMTKREMVAHQNGLDAAAATAAAAAAAAELIEATIKAAAAADMAEANLNDALGLGMDDAENNLVEAGIGADEVVLADADVDADVDAAGGAGAGGADDDEDEDELGAVAGVPEGVSAKSWWLRHAIDKNTVLILDESHNAAGSKSNSGSNIAAAVAAAGYVVFSSATYAKNARTMEIYAPLFPKDFDSSNIAEIINRGGDDMHSILTNMLVKDGVMISRQHDLSNCAFVSHFDEKYSDRNKDYLARLAPILSEMSYMSGDIGRRLNDLNSRKAQELRNKYKDNEDKVRGQMRTMGLRTVAFGSPLYQISKLCVASLLVDCTVEGWIKALEEGRKPMVFTENTIQGLMSDMQAEGQGKLPDFRDLMKRVLDQLCRVTRSGKKKGDVIAVANPFTPSDGENMADRLAIIVRGAMSEAILANADPGEITLPELDEDGQPVLDIIRSPWKAELYAALVAAADSVAVQDGLVLDDGSPKSALVLTAMEEVRELIENLHPSRSDNVEILRALPDYLPPTPARSKRKIVDMISLLPSLPASAIDEIRERVEAEGLARFERGEIERPWVIGEITGRTLEVRNGEIVSRSKGNKFDIRDGFNNGSINGLILNAAGATSVSLHAGVRCKDQSQREMWMLQQHADIMKFIQAIGRIYRYDQVVGPIIVTPLLQMPAHERLLAMQNVKLRRLSANIQAASEHPASMDDIADLMNPIGDKVIGCWAEDHPDIMRRMGLEGSELTNDDDAPAKGKRDNESRDNEYIAHKFFSRLIVLPPDLQVSVLAELKILYKAALQELNDKGENPLETRVINGNVIKRKSDIYLGHDADGVGSVFHDPVYVQSVVIEHAEDPLRSQDVGERIDGGMASYAMQSLHNLPEYMKQRRNGYILKYLLPGQTEAHAIAAGGALAGIIRRLDILLAALPRCVPGMVIETTMEGVVVQAVITVVQAPQGEEAANTFDGHFDRALRQSRSEFLASNYVISIAIPGTFIAQHRALSSLLAEPDFRFVGHMSDEIDGLPVVDSAAVMDTFDQALEGQRLSSRIMLVGNDWAAMQGMLEHNLGYPVVYKDEDGNMARAVMVTKKKEALNFLPIRMSGRGQGTEMAAGLISEGKIKLYGVRRVGGRKDMANNQKSDGLIVTWLKKRKKVKFGLPAARDPKHGWIMREPAVVELVERLKENDPLDHFGNEFNKAQCIMVDANDAAAVFQVFVDSGMAFYAPASMSEVVDNWKERRNAVNEANEQEPDEDAEDVQEPDGEDPMLALAAA